MCKSVKGAAYFGSSVHVVAAFIFFFWFLFDTVITEVHINLWRCLPPDDDPPKKYNVVVHYLNLSFKLLYYLCLCVTGIYIFRGVERNSPRIIKFALLVFTILQIVSLALFITISLNYWTDDVEEVVQPPYSSQKPVASPLMDPNLDDFSMSGSLEESDENATYDLQIEIFSHAKPALEKIDSSPTPKWIEDEEHFDRDPMDINQNPILQEPPNFLEPDDNYELIENRPEEPYLSLSLAPENLVNRPETEEVFKEAVPITTDLPPSSTSGKNSSEEEMKAVLENPLDILINTTTPMPMPGDVGVVLVEVVKEHTPQTRLSHNQLVTLVFQVFLLGFNAVGSCIYVGVLVVHLITL